MPFNTCLKYEVPSTDAALVWRSLGEGGVFITREGGKPFVFAAPTEQPPTLKADAERLNGYPEIVDRLLGLYALHPCVIDAEVLSFVPNGMADFGNQLGRRIGKPVINLFRPEGAPRSDIRFVVPHHKALAREAHTICAVEDISTTGFSAHATARVLRGINPELDIHSLSMLQRDAVDPVYTEGTDGVAYHTFVRQDIPLTVEAFRQQFPDISVATVA
jgi:hypothetical protein